MQEIWVPLLPKEERLKVFYNIEQEDQKLKNRVMVDY